MTKTPDFTLGIEEEYLLVNAKTGELAELPDALMERCKSELEDRVSPEFLRCQIEIGTPVCKDIKEAREELTKLRRRVAEIADDFGLAPIAASCHPFADWRNQLHTDKDRYNALSRDLAAVVRRMLVGGMHVHVGIEDKSQRIDLMNQLSYFLPHFLAISTSSPFWQGEDTGLASYRLTVFGNMPRTGLPPLMHSWAEFERSVGVLSDLDVIEDASKIWWDLRPSVAYPTLETRICDVCPNIERALSIAALIQGTLRMLWRLSKHNIRWRQYDNFLLGENRWRALRYGTSEGLIDFGAGRIEPFKELAEEWVGLLKEDGEALNSTEELEALHGFVADGTSSERQRTVFSGAMSAGATRHEAHRAVVMDLIEEYHRGL